MPTGGLAILSGNLAPEGRGHIRRAGPAAPPRTPRVFDARGVAMPDAGLGTLVKALRYRARPHARGQSTPLAATAGKVALITAAASRAARGAAIGHISPEAAQGGPIALLEEGDVIELDIPGRRIDAAVDDAEMKRRAEAWRPPAPRVTEGVLAEYARRVSSASRGAVRLRFEEC